MNAAVYSRVRDGGTITKIGVGITAQSGNISVAVYSNAGTGRDATPGTLLATSGAVACPAVGYAEVALGSTITVKQGDWIGVSADNTTVKFKSLLSTPVDHNLGKGRQYRQATAHPLPATVGILVATIGYTFVLVGAP